MLRCAGWALLFGALAAFSMVLHGDPAADRTFQRLSPTAVFPLWSTI